MESIIDIWNFLKVRKKFWLLPAMITLIVVGGLLIFGSGLAISPFIYTIF